MKSKQEKLPNFSSIPPSLTQRILIPVKSKSVVYRFPYHLCFTTRYGADVVSLSQEDPTLLSGSIAAQQKDTLGDRLLVAYPF